MTWIWRYRGADGEPVEHAGTGESEVFTSQSDAESWLGENWRELMAGGVQSVELLEEDKSAYVMELTPAR